MFEIKLKEAIQKLPFQKILTLKNVQQVVNEADGYQPHIIAPENGYRRWVMVRRTYAADHGLRLHCFLLPQLSGICTGRIFSCDLLCTPCAT